MADDVAAVVTDPDVRAAVAGIRGLGRAGTKVVAVSGAATAAGVYSRYVAARYRAPHVLDDPARFRDAVADAAARHAPAMIYPGREESLGVLLGGRSVLAPCTDLAYPPADVVHALRQKVDLAALADDVGLAAPRTAAVGTAAEFRAAPPPLPCVVKEAEPGGAVELTSLVRTKEELAVFLARLPDEQPLLAQEAAEGPLISLALVLARGGRVVGRFQQVALRTWPARAGGTSFGRSVALDHDLADRSTALLARNGYWGLAQLQFIGTEAGPLLIDVNPRFYGTLPLALASGVNLPALWHAVATGDEGGLPDPPSYRAGVAYRWLEADVSAALQGDPSRLRPLRARAAGAMWDGGDPIASIALAATAFGARATRFARRIARRARTVVR